MTYTKVIIIVTALTLLPMQVFAQTPPKTKVGALIYLKKSVVCPSVGQIADLLTLIRDSGKVEASIIAAKCGIGVGEVIYGGIVKNGSIGTYRYTVHKFLVSEKAFYGYTNFIESEKEDASPTPVEGIPT